MVKLNSKGRAHARKLISDDKVDKTSDWDISADDENKLLNDPPDFAKYGTWFLGVDDAENADTKAHYKYPVGKNGKIYRKALTAVRQRAGQRDADDIFDAAGSMLDLLDRKKNTPEKEKNDIIPKENKTQEALDAIEHMMNMA